MRFKDLFNDDLTVKWDAVEAIPEFARLKGCPQHELWHREGDVWTHTKNVVFAMQELLTPDENGDIDELFRVNEKGKKFLMYAALCHDLGKPLTTKKKADGHWGAKYHDDAGARIVRQLFREDSATPFGNNMGFGGYDTTYVVANLTALHMKIHYLLENREKFDDEGVNNYLRNLEKRSLLGIIPVIILSLADDMGSENDYTDEYLAECTSFLKNKCKELKLGRWYGIQREPSDGYDFLCYVMMGLPGAGKSTFAEYMARKGEHPIFSNDGIRRNELGIKDAFGTPEEEKRVRNICWEKIANACKEKKSFIVDNTNINKWVRQRIAREVWTNGGNLAVLFIDAPLEVCIERRYEKIPEKLIRAMDTGLDLPSLAEADAILVIRDYDQLSADPQPQSLKCTYLID